MKVLVTGHRGYVGALLTPMLTASGHDPVGLDADFYAACDFGDAPVPAPDRIADVRDATPDDLVGFDAVVHLAGLSNDPLGHIDPALTREINTEATVRLAKAAKDAGVPRFIFSSSCSNYGAAGTDWLDEQSPLNPVTPYAVSKVESEERLDALADDCFSPVYLRSATAYGLSPRLRFDLVVNNLTAWAVTTGEVRLKSDGSAWRPLVHAEDMARAFIVALEADRDAVHRQAFNVGRNDEVYQIRDVAKIVNEVVEGSTVSFAPGRIVDERTYKVDCSKIAKIGFAPQRTVRSGVEELRDAFVAHDLKLDEFEGPRYQRVAHIRSMLASGEFDESFRRPRTETSAVEAAE